MPGSTIGIDTDKEFHVRLDFQKDAENLFNGYSVTLTQGSDRRVEMSTTDCDYLKSMTNDI